MQGLRNTLGFITLISLLLVGLSSEAAYASPAVKLSSGGICHPVESSWYGRTKKYTGFDSLSACLSEGGRLPEGLSLASINNPQYATEQKDYERSAFGHGWGDVDGDCRNSRAEALIATSTTGVRFAGDRQCRVVTGRWISPFTGNGILNAADIDIDHVVPLAWAWSRGAGEWSREKREKFANDLINLWPVEASLNRSKGAQGPNEWLPPSGQCGYVARFVRVVRLYDLQPSTQETSWFQAFLEECRK